MSLIISECNPTTVLYKCWAFCLNYKCCNSNTFYLIRIKLRRILHQYVTIFRFTQVSQWRNLHIHRSKLIGNYYTSLKMSDNIQCKHILTPNSSRTEARENGLIMQVIQNVLGATYYVTDYFVAHSHTCWRTTTHFSS